MNFNLSGDEWIRALPAGQRANIEELIAAGYSDREIVNLLLENPKVDNTASFGGSAGKSSYSERFRNEFNRFICEEGAYTELKTLIQKNGSRGGYYLAGLIAASLAPVIGVVPVVVVPAVAVSLKTVTAMGVNAYCKGVDQGKAESF